MARILLVEDDGALRGALRELFEREGYEVAAAADAAAARSAMAAGADLVVLDVGLPDGDGVAVCRAWRAAGGGRSAPPLAGRAALWHVGAMFIVDNSRAVVGSRLGDKVGAAHIRTVRGVGYQWLD